METNLTLGILTASTVLLAKLLLLEGLMRLRLYERVETQTTNQWKCDHGQRPEANVGQQYR